MKLWGPEIQYELDNVWQKRTRIHWKCILPELISKTPMELLLGYFWFSFMLQLHIVKFALEMKTTEYY